MRVGRLLTLVLGVVLVLYPPLVYFGLREFGPRALATTLIALALLRFTVAILSRQPLGNGVWLLVAAAFAGGLTLITGSVLGLKFYPVVVNLMLLGVFAFSLRYPPSMIERFARLQMAELPPHVIAYTRKVTIVWCAFFVINGGIAAATLLGSDYLWTLYNGFISYLAMGALLAGEYLVRLQVQKRHLNTDNLLKENKFAQHD